MLKVRGISSPSHPLRIVLVRFYEIALLSTPIIAPRLTCRFWRHRWHWQGFQRTNRPPTLQLARAIQKGRARHLERSETVRLQVCRAGRNLWPDPGTVPRRVKKARA